MDSSGCVIGFGMELLNQSNYKVWKTCMESYLIGESLWEVVGGDDTIAPENNVEAFKQWRQKNARANLPMRFGKPLIGYSTRKMWPACNS
ncbi:hypothetical protein L6164_001141 [Bauhinia variegata]|uniref:Uncharacterized protein n=1 Tax=Bauhinia variegata TaxID=167791 RepID=A0ACB9Q871_BAUVA|nr:hypothetical protein L6164_001141 [Bauhinia variegata]